MTLYRASLKFVFLFALGCSAMPDGSTTPTTHERGSDESSAERSSVATEPTGRPFSCSGSEKAMFEGSEPLVMRISGDFTQPNSASTKEESSSPAQISLPG